ncbi:MAG: AAA family ATPase [Planctomycetota bacterium]
MEPLDLRKALEDPSVLPGGAAPDAVLETHVSVLAFCGERVFKLKKAVDLGFVDQRSLAQQRHFASEELRLNARLSPDLYVGLAELRRGPDGLRLCGPGDGSPGEAVAVGIEMRRLPLEGMLDRKLDRGEIDNRLLGRLAERLAGFHAEAERGPEVDACASLEVISKNALDNFEATRAAVGDVVDSGETLVAPALHAHLEAWTRAFLERERERFERRVHQGRAVDGHGDLHAGNVCVDDERLWIYDCVEFEPAFRRGDPACDLAFLCMDIDRGGYRAFARFLAKRYADLADDPELLALLPFYKVYRALVRAKVDGFVALDGERAAADRAAAVERAREHFGLAASYTLPPALVLTCGLPATGKSWIARRLAARLGGGLHRSDVVRKQLAGVPVTTRREGGYDEGLYTPENKQRTYDALLDYARTDLGDGRSAIVDGSFLSRKWREPFAALADELGAPLVLVHMHADVETVKRRIEERLRDPNEPSEADFEVYLQLAQQVELPTELDPAQHLELESGGSVGAAVQQLLERVLVQTSGG